MKKCLLTLLGIILLSGMNSFAGQEQTIANLKAAYKGESTASTKYAAYAEQAKKEGLTQIAIMFSATSKSEAIHAGNHKKVLEKMGQKVDPVKPEFTVKTTKENIQDAINGESYENTNMYPDFIGKSKTESANDATKSFTWAMDTEKKHELMYKNALKALNESKTASLPTIYWVCPKCGNTYDVKKTESACSFCSTKNSLFIKFE